MVMIDGVQNGELEVRCPRCGYDLRGVVQAWAESCPLVSPCAECGQSIDWARQICPGKFVPFWCIEFAQGRLVRACAATAWRSLWPWYFWKRMSPSFGVEWRRLVLYALACLFTLPALFVLEQAAVAIRVRLVVTEHLQRMIVVAEQELSSDISSTKARIRMLESSIDQGGELDGAVLSQLERRLDSLQSRTPVKLVIRHPYHVMLLEAVLQPTARTTTGTVETYSSSRTYVAPGTMHQYLVDDLHEDVRRWFDLSRNRRMIELYTASPVLFAVSMPIGVSLLAASRRRRRLRWPHIGRVAAYSVLVTWNSALLLGVFAVVVFLIPGGVEAVGHWGWFCIGWVPTGVLLVHWAVAITRYLRIGHGWLVVLMLALITLLATTLVLLSSGVIADELVAKVGLRTREPLVER